jgi:hypothetical protein
VIRTKQKQKKSVLTEHSAKSFDLSKPEEYINYAKELYSKHKSVWLTFNYNEGRVEVSIPDYVRNYKVIELYRTHNASVNVLAIGIKGMPESVVNVILETIRQNSTSDKSIVEAITSLIPSFKESHIKIEHW